MDYKARRVILEMLASRYPVGQYTARTLEEVRDDLEQLHGIELSRGDLRTLEVKVTQALLEVGV